MSKQQVKSTPAIYVGLIHNAPALKHCICEDTDGNFFRFLTPQENHIVEAGRQKVWNNFDAFCEENEQTVLTYHDNHFGNVPPKKQDLITTKLHVWNKLVQIATDRTGSNKTPTDPVTARKSTILNCLYRPGENPEGTGALKTPQALNCLRLFRACLTEHAVDKLDPSITELVLKQYIIDHAADLHTRQDPWRIFQYYRPALISEKLLRRI